MAAACEACGWTTTGCWPLELEAAARMGFVAQTPSRPRYPQPQTQLRHSGHRHRHRHRAPKLCESVEQSHPHMKFCDLALERARHHPLAQPFEAVHLGLHQASSVVAAPFFPDAADTALQPLAGSQRSITHRRSHPGLFPRLHSCAETTSATGPICATKPLRDSLRPWLLQDGSLLR